MKKTIIALAILMLFHIAALAVISSVYYVDNKYYKTYGTRPDVECFEFVKEGGLAGGFHYRIRVWHDAMGYHLYYKDRDDFEKTFTLTKLEYLQCTAFSRETINKMASFDGMRITDGFRITVRVKFKGTDEILIPAKTYDLSIYELPMDNVIQMVWVKRYGHDNDNMAMFSRLLCSYCLKNNVDSYYLSYYRSKHKLGDQNNRMTFSKGIITLSKEIVDFQRVCRRTDNTEDCTVIDYEGQKAYIKDMEADGVVCFYIRLSESKDEITLYSDMPEGVTLEEYRQELCSMLMSNTNGNIREKAVLIEVAAFFAAAFIIVLITSLTGRTKKVDQ